MKLYALTFAIVAASLAGNAFAQGSTQQMPPVAVSGMDISGCTPPADAPACGAFHQAIRANFSRREIGMLFGSRTNYPEGRTGGIDQLQRRYNAWLRGYIASQQAVSNFRVAGK
ncbi:MAG TPA: hypothetical protein VF284_01275 [Rhodanobacteraceae bacterium]